VTDAPSPETTDAPGPVGAPEPALPRWLLVLGVPVAGLVLVTFFTFLRFPFDRFGDAVARQAGAALGAEVDIARLEPALTLGGPGLAAHDVLIRWPDGARARVETARLRPAWSASWLAGRPAVHLKAASDVGAVDGTFTLGDAPGFDGRLEAVSLARLPVDRFAAGASLDGTLDLDADLVMAPTGPVGRLRFEARDGSLAAAQLPVALPYAALRGAAELADDGSVALEDVALEGPMLSATVEGGTGPGPSLWLAPLDLRVHLEVSDRNLRPSFRAAGLRLDADGATDVRVRGNLSAPVVR